MTTRTIQIELLGDFRLLQDGTPLAGADSPRLQSLLAYLVLHRDAAQSRSHLAFLFWPDSTEAQARTNLRKQVYHLRQALPDADRFLHADGKVVQWRADAPYGLDVADFQEAVARAEEAERAGNEVGLRASLERAVDLYRGDLLPSCYDDWLLGERELLRQQFATALERLIRLLEGQRDYQAALRYAQRLLRHDPLREETYRLLMRLHALLGDRAQALRTYHECVSVLRRELDVEPSSATRSAFERLLQHGFTPAQVEGPQVLTPSLVGREGEWRQMEAAWRSTLEGQPHFVVLTGEAGIGKTRLAEELLDWANRQGIATAVARCYASGSGLAYAPVTAWLRSEAYQDALSTLDRVWLSEVARLLPELLVGRPEIPLPGPLTESWHRQRLFQALARAFSERSQLVLLLDDLQWSDQETLEWLSFLLRGDAWAGSTGRQPARLLLAGTLRTEEMPDDGALPSLLQDLRRSGRLTELKLGPLDEAATAALAASVAGRELNSDLAAGLYRETEGNPLFVVETVRAMLPDLAGGEGVAGQEAVAREPHSWPVPGAVQDAIQARLAGLSPQTRELVGVAATIGREFTLEVLLHSSAGPGEGADEELVVGALDELWRRRIVREQGDGVYDFAHDKIREVAYTALSAVRRRYLHRRVAVALVRQARGGLSAGDAQSATGRGLDAVSGQVAAHYEQAGLPDRAVPYYRRAAEAARQVYANGAAIGYYQRALACLERSTDAALLTGRCSLYDGLGQMLRRQARYAEAQAACEAMRDMAEAAGNILCKARAWNRLSDVQGSRNRHQLALESAARAEKVARAAERSPGAGAGAAESQVERAMALFAQGWAQYHLGDAEAARALGEEALALSTELEPRARHVMARSHNLLGVTYKMLGDYARSLHHQEQALSLFEEVGDERRVAGMLSNLGETERQQGNYARAIPQYRHALAVARKIGDRDWEMTFLSNLGAAQVGLGEYVAAEADLRQAIDMAAAAGEPGLSETHSFLAEACLGQGKVDEALVAAQRALSLARESGQQVSAGVAWRVLGMVAARLGEPVAVGQGEGDGHCPAGECFAESLRILSEVGAEAEAAQTVRAWEASDPERAPRGASAPAG